MNLVEPIISFQSELQQIRRDLHAHPELCYEEQRTSDVIADKLTQWGIPVVRGLGLTGVVGIIRNGTSERAIGLRADMDALPMQERCMRAATTATRPCCSAPPTTCRATANSTVLFISFSSRPRKAAPARAA